MNCYGQAKEMAAGKEIDGRKIRVDFSITKRAHTPTPGVYLGKPTPGYVFFDSVKCIEIAF